MTTHIIYHDFRNSNPPCPRVMLTAPVLTKGRRLFKTASKVNTGLNRACIFLCGACAAVSLFVFLIAWIGG